MTVYVVWHGGHSYAPGTIATDLERFDTLGDAVEACESRYVNADGSTPAVDETSGMSVWRSDPSGEIDPYPDDLIVRGRNRFRVMGA